MDFADIGIEHRAVGLYPVTGVAGATVLSGWRRQFRVIPDSHANHIAWPNAVLIRGDFLVQRHIWLGDIGTRAQLFDEAWSEWINIHHFVEIKIGVLLFDHILAHR
ncbi:hypothetical protein D3C85_1324330 [compost metagenome]